MTRRSGPKAAPRNSTPIDFDHHRTAVARLEAAQAGLTAHVVHDWWTPEEVEAAAIRLIDAALADLAVVS